jgi:hypothetical protein
MEEEKKDKKPDVDYVKLIRSNEKKKSVIVILIFLIIMMAAVIALFYFGIVNMPGAKKCMDDTTVQNTCTECPKCEDNTKECNCPACTTNLGEKISSVKEIKLTEKNQTIKIGNKEFKVRVGTGDNDGILAIDDFYITYTSSDGYVDHAYLTDKFIFFTNDAQAGEIINYAYSPVHVMAVNDNGFQLSDNSFKVVNGYLHTEGAPFCGDEVLDPNTSKEYIEHCKDRDLLVKYIDNTLIVVDAK